jgi:hypothetical protein
MQIINLLLPTKSNTMKKAMLGFFMLLATTCIVAQEPEKSKTPPTPKPAPSAKSSSSTAPAAKQGNENKSNAAVLKGAGRKETGRDAAKEKNTKAPNAAKQRDRPKDIPN